MRRSTRRFGGLEALGKVIRHDSALRVPPAVETSPISFADWEAAVGTRVAGRARPIRFERGVLLVRTATAQWAQELALLSETMIANLRERLPDLRSLRFRVGHVDPPDRPPTRDEVRTEPPAVPLPPELGREVARVADPELREAIARAAAKNLGWQATAARPAARAPRDAESETAAPARASRPSPAGRRGTP